MSTAFRLRAPGGHSGNGDRRDDRTQGSPRRGDTAAFRPPIDGDDRA